MVLRYGLLGTLCASGMLNSFCLVAISNWYSFVACANIPLIVIFEKRGIEVGSRWLLM